MNDQPPFDLKDEANYRHFETVSIRFSDEDRLGHINNAIYLNWIEVARVSHNRRFLSLAPKGLSTVVAKLSIDYLKETSFPGEVRIGTRLTAIGNRSFRTGYGVFRDGVCLATAECVNVFFDTATRASTAPTAEMRAVMEREFAALKR